MRMAFIVAVVALVPWLPATTVYAAPDAETRATVTAYTSSADETDDTPFVNAAGTKPGPGSVACPVRLPLGTKVRIGGRLYTCDDRMAARFQGEDRFDVWCETKAEAYKIGRQKLAIAIYL